jgi:hypothetical protein
MDSQEEKRGYGQHDGKTFGELWSGLGVNDG